MVRIVGGDGCGAFLRELWWFSKAVAEWGWGMERPAEERRGGSGCGEGHSASFCTVEL